MIGKNAEAYAAEWLLLQKTQNPRLINENSYKLRAAYDGARTIFKVVTWYLVRAIFKESAIF